MSRIFSILLLFTWCLWLGGMIALFLFVQTLFVRNRPAAVQTAPILFLAFERYELVLGAIALAATVAWRVVTKSGLISFLLFLLILLAIAAVVSSVAITGPMEYLRDTGRTDTPEFRRYHGYSMLVYAIQAGLLVLIGLTLPFAIWLDPSARVIVRPTPPAGPPPDQTTSQTPPP